LAEGVPGFLRNFSCHNYRCNTRPDERKYVSVELLVLNYEW
jgi:hypothetical protein